MKIEIDKIEINEAQIEAVVKLKANLKDDYNFGFERRVNEEISRQVVAKLVDKFLLENGPSILSEINNNQIINAVIMRAAGALSGRD